MANERLRTTLTDSEYDERSLADELGLDPKSVQRWITRGITPRRITAHRAAKLLGVPASWIWPDLETERESASQAEIVTLYPHRSEVPRHLWLDLVTAAGARVWLYANASLFVAEDNPESIDIIRRNLSYYAPLVGVPGVEFRLQRETLYNSIFVYDEQMLVNQHVYGMYGYMAPILHLRRIQGGDFFDMYVKSFERVWDVSFPIEESNFWRQRTAAINSAIHAAPASSPGR